MSITSLAFLLFVFATFALFYIVPKRFQWIVLLISSLTFYIMSSTWGIVYLLVTATSIFFGAIAIENNLKNQKKYIKANKETLSKEEKSAYKNKNKTKRKRMMIAVLVLNISILSVLKYCHFAVDLINPLLEKCGAGLLSNEFKWLVPLGLSFYTFQAIGYIVDVYWEKIEAQRNPLKMLLFVSFFPQVTQGPISNYAQLSKQLFSEHKFAYTNFSRGFQRSLWGFFKKLVIADYISVMVAEVFKNYNVYPPITCIVTALLYSVQIYADFSGYMDIMCGICEMLDIKLAENFMRPYFSKSIAEYWRRWHITLGVWFKNYIYYPIGVSRWAQKLGKSLKKPFGQKVAQNVPATIALLLVWFVTGLWHGASFAYIVWGLINGVIIIFSMWMEPIYEKGKSLLHIKSNSFYWRAFCALRTFALVTLIKILPEVGSFEDGFKYIGRFFAKTDMEVGFSTIFPAIKESNYYELYFVLGCIGVMFVASLIARKQPVRDLYNRIPWFVRIIITVAITLIIASFGALSIKLNGGFMYAQF